MTHEIAFPALGLQWTIQRVAVTVLGKDIYWYGVIICLGFLLGTWYLTRRCTAFGIQQEHLMDCMILGVPIGILSARLYYVAFQWDYYREHLSEVVAIWNGGIAIYGAVIGVILTLLLYSRYRGISFLCLCDLAALGLPIGQCVGRWGNFINAEAHGGPTSLPWGMSIDDATPVHPTFLYESFWVLIGFLALHAYSKRRKFDGEIALLYVAWYGLGRAWIEGLRTDSLYWGSFRVSQVLAIVSCLAAVGVLVRQYRCLAVAQKFYQPPSSPSACQPAPASNPTPIPASAPVPDPQSEPTSQDGRNPSGQQSDEAKGE